MNDPRDLRGSDHAPQGSGGVRRDHQDYGGDRGPSERENEHGPADSEFLNLEMSKVVLSDAESLIAEAGRDILRAAIRERIEERFGDRLRAVGHLVADAAMDDLEANLSIESLIHANRNARRGLDERVREVLGSVKATPPPAAAPTAPSRTVSRGSRGSKQRR
jgi:hypothetical protein